MNFLRWDYIPFRYKLMISYLLFVIIPIAVLGIFTYTTSVQSHRDRTSDNLNGTLQQVRDNILYRVGDVDLISNQLFYNYTLQNYLRRYEAGWYSYETTTKYIIPTIEDMLNYTRNTILLTLYIKNTTLPEKFYIQDQDIDPLSRVRSFELFHQNRIENEDWYKEIIIDGQFSNHAVWRQIGLDEQHHNISLLRPMIDIQEWKHIGLIRITVKLNELFQSLDYRKFSQNGYLYITDHNNKVLYLSSSDLENPNISAAYIGSEQQGFIMLGETIDDLDLNIYAYISDDVIIEHANKIRNLTLLICVASILILSGIIMIVSKYLTKRVAKIVSTLYAFQEGAFHKRIPFSGNDEFAQIASAFNSMGQNMSELIQEVYVANLKKKDAELTSLQAQINPHFLYNTLSSISRLAKFGEIDKLHQMVLGLAKFYRLSLNEGQTIIPVSKELEQVTAYIDIQKIKYGERIIIHYDIDPDVYRYDTVKLILQPFVENILEHAWYENIIHLRIIAALMEDQIEFKIIDDGIGMTPDFIDQIFSETSVRLGYGIRNVNERIKLQFDEQYGVQIHSEPKKGTEVTITLPKYNENKN